jgi:7-carboxy-7-deazaguanine synthase
MFGKNPIRPPEKGDGTTLKIVEIFPTLQGEGPFVGQPAVFVRLGGCNRACSFCDTEFEAFDEMELTTVVAQVEKLASAGEGRAVVPPPIGGRLGGGQSQNESSESGPLPTLPPEGGGLYLRDLVVITGGEPLRQNIAPLCEALLDEGFRVQIETNGTLWRPLPAGVNIVCSPKVTDGRYHPLRPDVLARVDALKFIVSADDADYRTVGEVGQTGNTIPVYVQPMDEYDPAKNAANAAHALALAQTHGYRLSTQMHKVWGIA